MKSPGQCNITCGRRQPIAIQELPSHLYAVNKISRTLSKISNLNLWTQANYHQLDSMEQDLDYSDRFMCIAEKVRVIEVQKGNQISPSLLYFGPIQQLEFDPNRYTWPQGVPFLQFSTKQARDWLRSSDIPVDLSRTKWRGILPRNASVDWKDTWRRNRAHKDAAFIWSVWHKAVAVNDWRKVAYLNIDSSCPFCPGLPETILHRFWECTQARNTWMWSSSLIHALQRRSQDPTVHFNLDWFHCIFTQLLPRRFGKFSSIWSMLRGLTLWELWLARNARCFSNVLRSTDTITSNIWCGLQDYARLDWLSFSKKLNSNPRVLLEKSSRFDRTWGNNRVFCSRSDSTIRWLPKALLNQGRVAPLPARIVL